ncbi:MAG TPA: hypothetical protein DER12_10100 [Lachnospiraceae bacterium]|nr:hypothetical protein [Lachnospiraceae bacterium]
MPEGWSWARLNQIFNFIDYRGSTPTKISSGVPLITAKNVKSGYIDYTVDDYISEDEYADRQQRGISCYGDILFTTEAPLGNAAIADLDKFSAGQRLITFQHYGNQKLNNTNFLYFLLSDFFQNQLNANKTGSTVAGIKAAILKGLFLPVPPIEEQQRIAASCKNMFNMIEIVKNEQEDISKLISITKSKILDLAIRGKLVPQDPNDEPASVLLDRIQSEKEELIKAGKIKRDKKESVIFKGEDNSYYEKIGSTIKNIDNSIPFEIPENWCFIRLKELWKLISGRDLSPSEYNDNQDGIPYITGASNFRNGKIELVRWTSSPQVITKQGDLLLTCKGTVGELAFNDFGNAHIARQIMAIRNTYGLNVEYLSFCISFYIEEIKAVAKGLIPGISREDILNLILPIPPENYQRLVVSQIRRSNHALYLIEKSLI